jgi:CRP-like cAMP-binding protein
MASAAAPEFLNGLSADEAVAVLALGARKQLAPGTVLFKLGDAAHSLYLIERGRIALTLPMQVKGEEQDIMVEERIAGQTVGWSALIPPHRFTLKATAQIETDVLAISRGVLHAHLASRPAVANTLTMNLASVIGQRLQVFQAMWLREMQRVVELRSS